MGVEQREYERFGQEFPISYDIVQYSVPNPLPDPKKSGTSQNISGGGICLLTAPMSIFAVRKLLSKKTKFSLEFYLPDYQHKINVLGEARWSSMNLSWWHLFPKRWALGIKFIKMNTNDKDLIIKYVINKQIETNLVKK
jgi:hypothetical protein